MPARSIACDECRRRKVRCSAESTCRNCLRDRKSCKYSSLPHRVTALQNTVSHYEALLESANTAWAANVPNVPFAEALTGATVARGPQTFPQDDHSGSADEVHRPRRSTLDDLATTVIANAEPARSHPQQQQHEIPREQVRSPSTLYHAPSRADTDTPEQSNAEDYEFDESQDYDGGINGSGLLTMTTRKAGYTGPQSGIAALKLLSPLQQDVHTGAEIHLLHSTNNALSIEATQAQAEIYVTQYFTYYHPFYPLLHEGLFRARMSGAVAKPRDGSWPLLLNMVLAMGAFAGDATGSDVDTNYYRLAKESVSLSVIEKGSLCYVQGLAIMANYLQKRNKPNAGFALVGIAWSMAMAIGLHREFGPTSTEPYIMEQRSRTWWSLYVFVSGAQLTLGRPPASLVGINVRMPLSVDDNRLAVDMTELPEPARGPTVTLSLIEHIKLAHIGNAIQTELLTNQIPLPHQVEAMKQQLDQWKANLPACFAEDSWYVPWFELPKRVLLWRANHLRIVLDRPFLFRAVTEKDGLAECDGLVMECIETADASIVSICDFLARSPDWRRGFAWYATYWLISASFIHAICFAYTTSGPKKEQWRLRLRQAAEALGVLNKVHGTARQAREMLERLLSKCCLSADHEHEHVSAHAEHHGTSDMITEAWDQGGQPDLLNFSSSYFGFRNAEQMNQPSGALFGGILHDNNFADQWSVYGDSLNAEFLDAAGGFTLQSFMDAS